MLAKGDFSHLSSSDNAYIDQLYQSYRQDPETVDPTWTQFFQGFEFAIKTGGGTISKSDSPAGSKGIGEDLDSISPKEFRVYGLIQSHRARGHLLADTNPVRKRKDRAAQLGLGDYGLDEEDLNREFIAGQVVGLGRTTLSKIIGHLKKTYCGRMGVEFMHINNTDIRRWFRDRIERGGMPEIGIEKKKRLLEKLNHAVIFENFLHTKYVGQKRFSLEGGENTISALDTLINRSAEHGVEEVVIGMAHRGRLNVLANILGKTYEYIFSEFEGTAQPDLTMGDGDVKYHLGFSSQVKTPEGKDVYLKLMPNPSHLEAVNTVVLGYTRAQLDILYKEESKKMLPVLIHGDAAVAGQGIVYETIQMSKLDGYNVGGTIHFVINNQIGFTTDFDDARSSDYCTSIGRMLDMPIIHVNGDDAEAVAQATELAADFRAQFKRDVFVDMVCYRKHGHNESDEPKYTQPSLYGLISKHKNPQEVYIEQLIQGKTIERDLAEEMKRKFKQDLQARLDMVKQKALPYKIQGPDKQWEGLGRATHKDFDKSPKTGVKKSELEKVTNALTNLPEGFRPLRKMQRLIDDRAKRFKEDNLDWAMGEMLAYGSLLLEGVSVRMSGQDCVRGTFSHRHACAFDEETNDHHNFLNHIDTKQSRFRIYNSLLSEYGVLGFEYGYSLGRPTDINIWEAQFGDFANGAQTIIDQFISSGESKWNRPCGVLMFLPHGYEGQGPEHSNARPERYLQLCAELNMVVGNFTTPANMFHAIRRQVTWNFRKPLVVFTPKSLLRHPQCVSPVSDLTSGEFQEIILDSKVDIKKAKRLVMCTGKVYYDLVAKREELKVKDVAIVRLEQLYPLPEKQLQKLLKDFGGDQKVWCQEEPKNMGAWTFLLRYEEFRDFKLASRKSASSPATGYPSVHAKTQNELLEKALKEKL